MPGHPSLWHTGSPSHHHFALLAFCLPQLVPTVTPGRAVTQVQLHWEGPGQQCWVSPGPAQTPVSKKQDGFANSIFKWLTRGCCGSAGAGDAFGVWPALHFIICSGVAQGLAPASCSPFTTRLCRVFRVLPPGTKQLPWVQLVAGALSRLLPLIHWGGWGHADSFTPTKSSSSLLQQASASGCNGGWERGATWG